MRAARGPDDVEAIAVRQSKIRDDEMGHRVGQRGQARGAGGDGEHVEALPPEEPLVGGEEVRLIVHDQDALSHHALRSPPASRSTIKSTRWVAACTSSTSVRMASSG